MDKKFVAENKLFWKIVKSVLSDKVAGIYELHLTENNELVKTDLETAKVLNNIFPVWYKTLISQDIQRTNLWSVTLMIQH